MKKEGPFQSAGRIDSPMPLAEEAPCHRRDTRGGLTNNPSTRRTDTYPIRKVRKNVATRSFYQTPKDDELSEGIVARLCVKQAAFFLRSVQAPEPEEEKSGERVEMAELRAGTIIGARSEAILALVRAY